MEEQEGEKKKIKIGHHVKEEKEEKEEKRKSKNRNKLYD